MIFRGQYVANFSTSAESACCDKSSPEAKRHKRRCVCERGGIYMMVMRNPGCFFSSAGKTRGFLRVHPNPVLMRYARGMPFLGHGIARKRLEHAFKKSRGSDYLNDDAVHRTLHAGSTSTAHEEKGESTQQNLNENKRKKKHVPLLVGTPVQTTMHQHQHQQQLHTQT